MNKKECIEILKKDKYFQRIINSYTNTNYIKEALTLAIQSLKKPRLSEERKNEGD